MKKTILIGFAFSLLATTALAQEDFTSEGNTNVTGVLLGFKASNNVTVACNSDVQTYAATSDHLNGTRIYGTASGDPLIYFNEADKTAGTLDAGDTLGTTASDSDAFVDATNWSAL